MGADACGPNTLTVIRPPGDEPPDRAADTAVAEIAVPAVPEEGAAVSDRDVGMVVTVVSRIAAPQADADGALLASPP